MIALLAAASLQAAQPPAIAAPNAPPPPPVPAEIPPPLVPARAQAPFHALFSGDDYPAAALRNEEMGRTQVLLQIAPDGRVAGCVVTSSSGSVSLDGATCRILRARARFRPAEDGAGTRVWDTAAAAVLWRIPLEDERDHPLAGSLRYGALRSD